MKRKALSLAILSLVMVASVARADDTVTEKFSKTYPLAANGSLSLKNVNGGVTFEAWDRAEVQLQAEKKVKAGDDAEAREILRQIRIDVVPGPSKLSIETKMPKGNQGGGLISSLFGDGPREMGVTYHLRVPRGVIVEADNVNGGIRLVGTRGTGRLATVNGGITVEGTTGALVLGSTNGRIRVTRTEGTIKASTTNGGIEIDLARVPEGRELGLSTTNGSVNVRLPRDARLSLDATTRNGRINSELDVTGGEETRTRLSGDINGGGGTLRIRTTNGSVEIDAR